MRRMVNSFHDAGIAVIMDVVYNHTDGTGKTTLYGNFSTFYLIYTI